MKRVTEHINKQKYWYIALGIAIGVLLIAVTHGSNDKKVTICHRTDSVKNPYVKISVDPDSVDGDTGNDHGQGDHYAEHKGPVASSLAVATALKTAHTEWGDIIPPTAGHGGLNWTTDGQAMYNNDCNYVAPTTPDNPSNPNNPTNPSNPNNPTNPTTPEKKNPVCPAVYYADGTGGGCK